MLVDQTVEKAALLEITLAFQRRLRPNGRPRQSLNITELKAPGAVHVVLETGLAELEICR
jgi:hypothetical protein